METYTIDAQVVRETDKAVLVQHWSGSGSNPADNAREKWVPKSCVVSQGRAGIELKKWFVAQNRMWDWGI